MVLPNNLKLKTKLHNQMKCSGSNKLDKYGVFLKKIYWIIRVGILLVNAESGLTGYIATWHTDTTDDYILVSIMSLAWLVEILLC